MNDADKELLALGDWIGQCFVEPAESLRLFQLNIEQACEIDET